MDDWDDDDDDDDDSMEEIDAEFGLKFNDELLENNSEWHCSHKGSEGWHANRDAGEDGDKNEFFGEPRFKASNFSTNSLFVCCDCISVFIFGICPPLLKYCQTNSMRTLCCGICCSKSRGGAEYLDDLGSRESCASKAAGISMRTG
jgi:hypothetical protein